MKDDCKRTQLSETPPDETRPSDNQSGESDGERTGRDATPPVEDGAPSIENESTGNGGTARHGTASAAPTRRMPLPKKNFWINVASGVVLCAMVGTGILMKWVLPPGSRGGRGLVWLGESRHFWGDVHFWLATAMLTLLVVHLVLHRSWIVNCWRWFVGTLRSPATWGILVLGAALIALPLMIPRDRVGAPMGEGRGQQARLDRAHHAGPAHERGIRWRDREDERHARLADRKEERRARRRDRQDRRLAADRDERVRRPGKGRRDTRRRDTQADPTYDVEQDLGFDWFF